MSCAKWVFLFQLETFCENRRSRGHWHTFSVTMCICATWKLLCTSYWAGELCAPGSLVPVVPLQEYDKKQQKTNVLMWLQVRIFSVSVNASMWAPTSQDESFMNLGLFLIWQTRCQPTKTRDLKSLFDIWVSICFSYNLYLLQSMTVEDLFQSYQRELTSWFLKTQLCRSDTAKEIWLIKSINTIIKILQENLSTSQGLKADALVIQTSSLPSCSLTP